MVRIRLTRIGARNNPAYRVVAIDSRRARDSRYLEALGNYDPRRKILKLNLERVDYWLSKGAQPSNIVDRLINRYRKMVSVPTVPKDDGTGTESEPVRPTEPTN